MEQNTDRMWWTIGVVVLGGALIAGAVVLIGNDATGLLGDISDKLDALFGKVKLPA